MYVHYFSEPSDILSKKEQEYFNERLELAVEFLYCMTLVEILQKVIHHSYCVCTVQYICEVYLYDHMYIINCYSVIECNCFAFSGIGCHSSLTLCGEYLNRGIHL